MNRLVFNTPCRLKHRPNSRSNRYVRFQLASCIAGLGVVLLAAILATPVDFRIWNHSFHSQSPTEFKGTERSSIRNIASRIARENRVEPELVLAVIEVESRFNAKAKSPAGAKGLMQLMPATLREMNVADPYNPEHNIRGGVGYLSKLLSRYDGDRKIALAAYNAGPAKVDRHKGVPPYSETKDYVKKVLKAYNAEVALKKAAFL